MKQEVITPDKNAIQRVFSAEPDDIGPALDHATATYLIGMLNRHFIHGPTGWDPLGHMLWVKVGRPEMRRLVQRHFQHQSQTAGGVLCAKVIVERGHSAAYWTAVPVEGDRAGDDDGRN